MARKKIPFEATLSELEQLVERLEQGNLPLEESLKLFERGVSLTQACQNALETAEQKVRIVMEENGKPTLKPWTDELK
jgi:exodeoxyribonuclease VII small subunit